MDISKYDYFFFDFDGVIVDSVDIKSPAFGELFKDCGEKVVRKVMEHQLKNAGVPRYEKFRYYCADILNVKVTPEAIDDLDRRYSQLVMDKVVKAPFIKGIVDFLKVLNGNKKECFVISATPQKEVRHIARLKEIDRFFKEIVGSPTAKKDNMRYLLDKYDVNTDKSVYFGDGKSDYNVAAENNIAFIGVVCGENKELDEVHGIPKIKDFLFDGIKKEKGAKCRSYSRQS